jgi:hypothetical protein
MSEDPKPERDEKMLQTLGQLLQLTVFLSLFVLALLSYIAVFTQPKAWMTDWWTRITSPKPELQLPPEPNPEPQIASWSMAKSLLPTHLSTLGQQESSKKTAATR